MKKVSKEKEYLVSAVGEGKHNIADVPLIVRLFLEQLDPHVWDGHRETVVKSNSTLRDRSAQRWHTRHI